MICERTMRLFSKDSKKRNNAVNNNGQNLNDEIQKNANKSMNVYIVNPVNPVKRLLQINLYLILAWLLFMGPTDGLADDVGITKARLIQKSEKSYVLAVHSCSECIEKHICARKSACI